MISPLRLPADSLLGVATWTQLSPIEILLVRRKVVEVQVQKVARFGVCSGRAARAAPCRDTAEAQSLHEHKDSVGFLSGVFDLNGLAYWTGATRRPRLRFWGFNFCFILLLEFCDCGD